MEEKTRIIAITYSVLTQPLMLWFYTLCICLPVKKLIYDKTRILLKPSVKNFHSNNFRRCQMKDSMQQILPYFWSRATLHFTSFSGLILNPEFKHLVSFPFTHTLTANLTQTFCTVKNIRRIYGRIAGNQLPGHVRQFFTGTRKIISHGRIGKGKVVLLTVL